MIRYDDIFLKVSCFKLAESVVNLEFDIVWQMQPVSCWQILTEKKNYNRNSIQSAAIEPLAIPGQTLLDLVTTQWRHQEGAC